MPGIHLIIRQLSAYLKDVSILPSVTFCVSIYLEFCEEYFEVYTSI
jgi:hypothetical protein